MKKRIFSLLLVIVMVAAMLPTISLTADAADYASGQTVMFKSLKAGDILRKDSCITANGLIFTIKEINMMFFLFQIWKNQTTEKGLKWTNMHFGYMDIFANQ